MDPAAQFLEQLKNFDAESQAASLYLYTGFTIDHAAFLSRRLLNRLNGTPTFWLTVSAGLQTAAFVSLARIFDQTSPFNVDRLLKSAQSSRDIFSRDALADRKREGRTSDPDWLPDYLKSAYYPKAKDSREIRKKVAACRKVYECAVKPARDKYFAHREVIGHQHVQLLFADAKVRDLWRIVLFLRQLHEALWDLYHNGRKPRFRAMRYSIPAMFRRPPVGSSPLERAVRETQQLLATIENAAPNHALNRTVRKRRLRIPSSLRSSAAG